VDLGSPEDSGTEVVRRVRRDFGLPIIALTETEAPPVLAEAIDAGASGFLRRSAGSATVERAIEVVLEGGFFLQPEHARGMVEQLEDLHERARHEEASLVTPREAEVLQLLSEGLSARQMARRLSLSERTVNTHVAKLYRKLGVSNRVEAVRVAMRRRIVQVPK
jgi:Response regulator containing a CheY-like receiver domain and an HTH DNA-binding domain